MRGAVTITISCARACVRWPISSTGPPNRDAQPAAVDTSAVLEPRLGRSRGLGWIGKNTNLLALQGLYFFIGIVLT